MAKTVEESLLGDHSDQWTDSDCPEAKRIKVKLLYNLEHYITKTKWYFKLSFFK